MKHKLLVNTSEPLKSLKSCVDLKHLFRHKKGQVGFWFGDMVELETAKAAFEKAGADCEVIAFETIQPGEIIEREPDDTIESVDVDN